jgi:5-methylcytosine-specific restriction enzyme subunit McrC
MSGSAPRSVELVEWSSRELPGARLTRTDWDLADALSGGEGGRLEVDEHRGGVRIRARSWVGVVRFESFEVRVVPKLAGGNLGLVEMIELATGLDALRRIPAARDLDARGTDLFDLIALLLAEASEAVARQGIFADYIEREDELPVVRGRILAESQLLRRFGRMDRIGCRFDEHDRDVAENQLLALALSACARRSQHAMVRQRVRRIHALFEEVCSMEGVNPGALLDEMTYHRMNAHYATAHGLARIVVEGLGVDDLLRGGDTPSFAFLIDMNRLFERFLWRLMERLLADRAYRVHYQKASRSILWDPVANRPYTHVVPDLVLEKVGGTRSKLPIDAKYKLYDGRKASTGDIYQAFLYAYAFGEEAGNRRALVVHPASTDRLDAPARLQVHDAQRLSGAEIRVLSLPVARVLAELRGGAAMGRACAWLVEAVEDAS